MEYRNMSGEQILATKWYKAVKILQRLNHIHPSLMPEEVTVALNKFKRNINPYQKIVKEPYVDSMGRTFGAGRRKTSTARAYLVEGSGEVLINGKTLVDAFGRIHDRESAIWPLKATDRIGKYNLWALVQGGGGTTGQAEALTLAVAKALLAHEPALKPALRRGKFRLCRQLLWIIANNFDSWMCNTGYQKGGEEEAWTRQGEKDACLGQEIGLSCVCFYLYYTVSITIRLYSKRIDEVEIDFCVISENFRIVAHYPL